MSALLMASGSVSPKHATSPVDRISTPTVGSAPSICMNENWGAFTANPLGSGASTMPVELAAEEDRRDQLDQVHPRGLGDEGHRPRGPEVALYDLDVVPYHQILDVERSLGTQARGRWRGCSRASSA